MVKNFIIFDYVFLFVLFDSSLLLVFPSAQFWIFLSTVNKHFAIYPIALAFRIYLLYISLVISVRRLFYRFISDSAYVEIYYMKWCNNIFNWNSLAVCWKTFIIYNRYSVQTVSHINKYNIVKGSYTKKYTAWTRTK